MTGDVQESKTAALLAVPRQVWLIGFAAYAATLLGAVLVGLLALVGAASTVDSAASDVTGSDAGGALGLLVSAPFQLVGMAMAGVGHAGDALVEYRVWGMPLLLTAVYVGTLVGLSAVSERRAPSAGGRVRLLVGLLTAAVTAPAVLLLTWLAAYRADGASMGSASVWLLLGCFALTALAVTAGRWLGAGAPVTGSLDRGYLIAAQVWGWHLLGWLAVMAPVMVVAAWIRESFAAVALFPLWGPTVGLWLYGAGHLGAVNTAEATLFAWSYGPLWMVGLFVVSLAMAVLAAMMWTVRRRARGLAEAWWMLPSVFLVGGFAVVLAGRVTTSGQLLGFGATEVAGVTFWTPFVLAAWGALVELLARTAAPSLAAASPARLQRFLAGRRIEPGPDTPSPEAASGPSPGQRTRTKRLAVIAAGVVGLAALSMGAIAWANSHFSGPGSAAAAYLDAVVDGDVSEAVRLAPPGDAGQIWFGAGPTDVLLDDEIYRNTDARVSGYELGDITTDGDRSEIAVSLTGLGGTQTARLAAERDGRRWLFFDRWRIVDGGLLRAASLNVWDPVETLTVNGRSVAVGDSTRFWLLPGTYRFDPYADSELVASDPAVIAVAAGAGGPVAITLAEPAPSEKLVEAAQDEVDSWLEECMQSEELAPEQCPQRAYAYGDTRNVVWRLVSVDPIDFTFFDGTLPARFSVTAEAAVDFEHDESYGSGDPKWTADSDTDTIQIRGTVSQDGGGMAVQLQSW